MNYKYGWVLVLFCVLVFLGSFLLLALGVYPSILAE